MLQAICICEQCSVERKQNIYAKTIDQCHPAQYARTETIFFFSFVDVKWPFYRKIQPLSTKNVLYGFTHSLVLQIISIYLCSWLRKYTIITWYFRHMTVTDFCLTHYQTTNFRPSRIERLCRRQFQI